MRNAILFLLPALLPAADNYLFTSFRGNGETGVHFALSTDGYRWTPLAGDKPVVKPAFPGMLMRDPFLVQGPDKAWHMLWTTGWTRSKGDNRLTIGHASTKRLDQWSDQQMIDVPLDGARNAWAPEMAWDDKSGEWIIFWASTIPGKFPDTEGTGDDAYNHRLYAMRTRDFKTFSKPALWFDAGFNSIDSTIVKTGRLWTMVFKDERKNPLQKKLRLAFADSPAGPWRAVTDPFTIDWVEGPSVLKAGKSWFIYFDHYAKPQYYGAYLTTDWKTFVDVTPKTSFAKGQRHGTAVAISPAETQALQALP